jgi:tetratricopeptide (TPR) repeat protein
MIGIARRLRSRRRQAAELPPREHRHERSGAGETNPYGGQADWNVLTAREGSGEQPAHGAGGQRSYKPSQGGSATVVGIRISGTIGLRRGAIRDFTTRCKGPVARSAILLLALSAVPSNAFAQRDAFFSSLVSFYKTLGGTYGDEGPQLVAHLQELSTALERWNDEIRGAEQQLRPQLNGADTQTALQVHTLLASLYMERGRFDEALREFDEDIRIDPRRAAFHRFKGLVEQLQLQPAAAESFRTAWLVDPADPRNAYRLLAVGSAQTTLQEKERALETLAGVERDLLSGRRPRAATLFTNPSGIVDDAGGAVAFVPAAYARGFSLVVNGELDSGLAALRAAVATDPLVIDPSGKTETMRRGISALRQGLVAAAIEQFEAAVALNGDSAEAHRMLATSYGVNGDVPRSLQHLREAVRLNPRDERSRLALVRALDDSGAQTDTEIAVRAAIAELPDAGAFRWQLATLAARLGQTNQADLALISALDRYVVLVGRGELHIRLAKLAQSHLEYERAIGLLERAAALIPNNAVAHKTLARAYIEDGRDREGYAELVVALMLDPDDAQTLTGIGRLHLAAGRLPESIVALQRAVAIDRNNQEALQALGDALVRAGKTTEGRTRLQESEQLRTRSIDEQRLARTIASLTVQADIRKDARDFAGAIDLWDQIIQLQRGNASSHVRLAQTFVAAGRLDEAGTAYQAAIALGAGVDIHRRLAELYAALGRNDESARERASYVQQRLDELRQRAADPAR